jgi:putative FmdB family regulatory protein
MPIYEYRCLSCHHEFEVRQKFSDDPIKKCPQCGKPVRKKIGAPGIMFKGSGFYVTDKGKASQFKQQEKAEKPAETKETKDKPETKKKDE